MPSYFKESPILSITDDYQLLLFCLALSFCDRCGDNFSL
ncbi:unnamed protein product [Acanthoscelides obtectus]|uniref:Uncharacterized protein n=1 Tax=Acanthoscelides obtectus TaxID=200917 RepID=A0A9P0KD30_ACAOB|nr:unnamed protein product [Acanthoscelides obtectus]CAK1655481.1 hypothetical protein AOBTE_LOCUS19188 [Acanthoscelides obtectus]